MCTCFAEVACNYADLGAVIACGEGGNGDGGDGVAIAGDGESGDTVTAMLIWVKSRERREEEER